MNPTVLGREHAHHGVPGVQAQMATSGYSKVRGVEQGAGVGPGRFGTVAIPKPE